MEINNSVETGAAEGSDVDVVKELEQVITSQDEATAREFLTTNFGKFPRELQQQVALGFLEEGLGKAVDAKIKEGEEKIASALEMCENLKKLLAEDQAEENQEQKPGEQE